MEYGILLTGLAVLVAGVALSSLGGDRKLNRRLARIERKLDAVVAELGIDLHDRDLHEVKTLLQQGKKIQAVKAYRDATGADLKEAVAAVDRLAGPS